MKGLLLIFLCMLCAGCTRNTVSETPESVETSSEEESLEDKEKVVKELLEKASAEADEDRYYVIEALGNEKADNRRSIAVQFIKNNYPDYFSSEELLKKSIEYGYYLEMIYKDSENAKNARQKYYLMGKLVTEAAQAVYLEKCDVSDDLITDKMAELEDLLYFFYDKYYGKQS